MVDINNKMVFPTTCIQGKKVWVTGHRGMLGSALIRRLSSENVKLLVASHDELDLTNQEDVSAWMEKNRPELIIHVAAKVGGIYANATQPADFIRDNLMIQTNVIHSAYCFGVEKLIFVSTNCTYPAKIAQPISESDHLTGPLDENIRSYAISKIAGMEMCRAYRKQYGCNFVSAIPPNLYGPGDNYHPDHSHVVAGILQRTHQAKEIGSSELVVWGDGTPRRELLHVDDLAEALVVLLKATTQYDLYNVGSDHDLTISEIATIISDIVGFDGKIVYDTSKPNGTKQKLLNSSRIYALGWKPKLSDKEGLASAYEDYLIRLDATDNETFSVK